jgi:hypothetical protein
MSGFTVLLGEGFAITGRAEINGTGPQFGELCAPGPRSLLQCSHSPHQTHARSGDVLQLVNLLIWCDRTLVEPSRIGTAQRIANDHILPTDESRSRVKTFRQSVP